MTILNKVSNKTLMPGITAVPDVVDAPTIGTATDVGTSRAYNNGAATVTFTAKATGGAASSFTATSSPGGLTASGASSPLTVTGLSSATSYTFSVQGVNSSGTWPASSASNSITATTVPQAPTIGTFTDGGTGTTGTLSFTAGATGGSTITGYKYSTDGTNYSSASGTTSPLSLTGLTAGTYTFYLKATNANGDSTASSGVSGTVITPNSYESIATVTLGSATSSINFTSIPSTYKSIQIRGLLFTSANNSQYCMQLNGTTTNYGYVHSLAGTGTSAVARNANMGSPASYGDYIFGVGGESVTNATYPTAFIIDIIDYANTSKNKTVRIFAGLDSNNSSGAATKQLIELNSFAWNNTAAVSSLSFNGFGLNLGTNSTLALYGIKG